LLNLLTGRAERVAQPFNPLYRFLPTLLVPDDVATASNFVSAHCAGVTWYLTRRLTQVSQMLRDMQEERVRRETERTRTLGRFAFGAGGWGRILPGYGINDTFTLLAGAELGGGAMVRPNTGASQFIINYFPAIPVVLRVHHRTWHYDLEAAPVALFQADNTRFSYGFRVGGGLGFSALRRHNFLPWAGLACSYEHYFEGGGRAAAEFLRADLRVGFLWDPN